MSARIPAEVFPPGEFVRDEMEVRGWTQGDLAEILGRPFRLVNEILSGKRAITPETAKGLGEAFGTDPQFWMNLESSYRLSLVRKEDGKVARKAKLYGKAPIKEMIKRQWIQPPDSVEQLEQELVRFFEVATIDDDPEFRAVARKSTSYNETNAPQLAWYYRARHLAKTLQVAPFREEDLGELFARLRLLTVHEQEVRKVPRLLAEYGIRFVVVEHLTKTRIDGAAFWLDPRSPAVALSVRFDRIDGFWHTLGHELGHVKNRDDGRLDDDLVRDSPDPSVGGKPEIEQKADQVACDLLVPQREMESFIARVRPHYSRQRIIQFANRIRVHPGIIIGQLQHRGEIKYSQGREMLVKVRDKLTETALTDGWGFFPPTR